MKTVNKFSKTKYWRLCISVAVTFFMFLFATSILNAQQTKVTKKDVPAQVISAVEQNYLPCKDQIQWFISSEADQIDYYVAKASGKNISCEAVYDRNGKLMHSETIMTDVRMPTSVMATIQEEYPDWKVSNNKMVVRDFDDNKKHFEVVINRDGKKQTLYYDNLGKNIGNIRDFQRNEVAKRELPTTVVKAIEKNYLPCREDMKWYVSQEGNNPEEYVAKSTGNNMSCEAVYDSRGHLIRSTTVMTNVKLPEAVHASLGKHFPGWRVTADKAFIQDFNEATKYFEIQLIRDGESRTLYYNAKGHRVMPKKGVNSK